MVTGYPILRDTSAMSTIETSLITEPWPFRSCPACNGTRFQAAGEPGLVVLTCARCGHRWRYLLGYLINLGPQLAEQSAPTPPHYP